LGLLVWWVCASSWAWFNQRSVIAEVVHTQEGVGLGGVELYGLWEVAAAAAAGVFIIRLDEEQQQEQEEEGGKGEC
jgi:hypothetical protein